MADGFPIVSLEESFKRVQHERDFYVKIGRNGICLNSYPYIGESP